MTAPPRPPSRPPSRPPTRPPNRGNDRRPAGKRPQRSGVETPNEPTGRSPSFTYKLTIEYDGSAFSGWQSQQNARSIADTLRQGIERAGFVVTDLGAAGRTDSGVHALAQVVHLRLTAPLEFEAGARQSINDELPAGVHVLSLEPAAPRFHARHDARSRSYLYQISRRRSAFHKRTVWWVRDRLDLRAMSEAAKLLVGRHDFRRFTLAEVAQKGSTLVEIERVEIAEEDELILVRITASHFLWRMVRRVVGTLVEVGRGTQRPDIITRLLAPATEGSSSPIEFEPAMVTAPASGLFLEAVTYGDEPPTPTIRAVTPVLLEPHRPAGRSGSDRDGSERAGSAKPRSERIGNPRERSSPAKKDLPVLRSWSNPNE